MKSLKLTGCHVIAGRMVTLSAVLGPPSDQLPALVRGPEELRSKRGSCLCVDRSVSHVAFIEQSGVIGLVVTTDTAATTDTTAAATNGHNIPT